MLLSPSPSLLLYFSFPLLRPYSLLSSVPSSRRPSAVPCAFNCEWHALPASDPWRGCTILKGLISTRVRCTLGAQGAGGASSLAPSLGPFCRVPWRDEVLEGRGSRRRWRRGRRGVEGIESDCRRRKARSNGRNAWRGRGRGEWRRTRAKLSRLR